VSLVDELTAYRAAQERTAAAASEHDPWRLFPPRYEGAAHVSIYAPWYTALAAAFDGR
jgi:hypothetical protein